VVRTNRNLHAARRHHARATSRMEGWCGVVLSTTSYQFYACSAWWQRLPRGGRSLCTIYVEIFEHTQRPRNAHMRPLPWRGDRPMCGLSPHTNCMGVVRCGRDSHVVLRINDEANFQHTQRPRNTRRDPLAWKDDYLPPHTRYTRTALRVALQHTGATPRTRVIALHVGYTLISIIPY
jgi:hypothetical protein